MVVAVIALFIALGGTAFAFSSNPGGLKMKLRMAAARPQTVPEGGGS